MTASRSLVFTQSATSLALAIAFVAVIAGLAWLAWRRSGYRLATGFLEALRVLIAIGIAVTLNQPEITAPLKTPEIVWTPFTIGALAGELVVIVLSVAVALFALSRRRDHI
jgi:hypothetical protein